MFLIIRKTTQGCFDVWEVQAKSASPSPKARGGFSGRLKNQNPSLETLLYTKLLYLLAI
nr:MAG TPA: hypothetical protein [Bacteriophage sp.]